MTDGEKATEAVFALVGATALTGLACASGEVIESAADEGSTVCTILENMLTERPVTYRPDGTRRTHELRNDLTLGTALGLLELLMSK